MGCDSHVNKFLLGCLALFMSAITSGAQTTWKSYRSKEGHFAVRYPSSWFSFKNPLNASLESLDILSFPPSERVEGVVLKPGGAEITVAPAPSQVRTVTEWIARDTLYNTDVRRREVEGFRKAFGGCNAITKVSSRWDVGTGHYQDITRYYCTASTGLYAVTLTNWPEDPHRKNLQSIAFHILLSLRTWEESEAK